MAQRWNEKGRYIPCIPPEDADEIAIALAEGATLQDIACKYDCHRQTVYLFCERNGIWNYPGRIKRKPTIYRQYTQPSAQDTMITFPGVVGIDDWIRLLKSLEPESWESKWNRTLSEWKRRNGL